MATNKKAAKNESTGKRGRSPVWEPGTTPNKTDMKKLAKEFTDSDARKTKASLARFAVANGLSDAALSALSELCLDKPIPEDNAPALRRAALRDANGGAKVKQKSPEKGEAEEKPAAKPKGKGKGKGKPAAKGKGKSE